MLATAAKLVAFGLALSSAEANRYAYQQQPGAYAAPVGDQPIPAQYVAPEQPLPDAPNYEYPVQYQPQPGLPGQYQPQPGLPGQYQPQPGLPGQYQPQPGIPGDYLQPGIPGDYLQPGIPGEYLQPGIPGQYPAQPGTPGVYQPQPGTPGVYQPQPEIPQYPAYPVKPEPEVPVEPEVPHVPYFAPVLEDEPLHTLCAENVFTEDGDYWAMALLSPMGEDSYKWIVKPGTQFTAKWFADSLWIKGYLIPKWGYSHDEIYVDLHFRGRINNEQCKCSQFEDFEDVALCNNQPSNVFGPGAYNCAQCNHNVTVDGNETNICEYAQTVAETEEAPFDPWHMYKTVVGGFYGGAGMNMFRSKVHQEWGYKVDRVNFAHCTASIEHLAQPQEYCDNYFLPEYNSGHGVTGKNLKCGFKGFFNCAEDLPFLIKEKQDGILAKKISLNLQWKRCPPPTPAPTPAPTGAPTSNLELGKCKYAKCFGKSDLKKLVKNNLGGMGPEKSHPQLIHFSDVFPNHKYGVDFTCKTELKRGYPYVVYPNKHHGGHVENGVHEYCVSHNETEESCEYSKTIGQISYGEDSEVTVHCSFSGNVDYSWKGFCIDIFSADSDATIEVAPATRSTYEGFGESMEYTSNNPGMVASSTNTDGSVPNEVEDASAEDNEHRTKYIVAGREVWIKVKAGNPVYYAYGEHPPHYGESDSFYYALGLKKVVTEVKTAGECAMYGGKFYPIGDEQYGNGYGEGDRPHYVYDNPPTAPDVPVYGQPGYGQPGYGQPGYGQPGYGQPTNPPTAGGGVYQPLPGQPGYYPQPTNPPTSGGGVYQPLPGQPGYYPPPPGYSQPPPGSYQPQPGQYQTHHGIAGHADDAW